MCLAETYTLRYDCQRRPEETPQLTGPANNKALLVAAVSRLGDHMEVHVVDLLRECELPLDTTSPVRAITW